MLNLETEQIKNLKSNRVDNTLRQFTRIQERRLILFDNSLLKPIITYSLNWDDDTAYHFFIYLI